MGEHAGAPGPDAVLLLGARLGLFTGGRPGTIIPAGAKLVQVDAEAAEIGRLAWPPLPAGLDRPGDVIVFECVGVPGVIQQIIDGVPRHARIVIVGCLHTPDTVTPVTAILQGGEHDLRLRL